jgi:hypothetical protein
MWMLWVFPLAWTIMVFISSQYYSRYVHAIPIVRQIPPDGFVDDAARVRFWKTEPYYQRMRWKTKATPVFIGYWLAGVVLIYVYIFNLPVGIGVTFALAGLLVFLYSRRKKSTAGVHITFRGGFWVYGEM